MYGCSCGIGINAGNFAINVVNFRFENNTFVSTQGNLCQVFWGNLNGITVRNNILHSNMPIANTGNFTHTNNLYYMVGAGVGYSLGPGEKTGNPMYVNLGARNMNLQPSSPAIDAGMNLGYTKDYEDKPVPGGSAPDIGACEFVP